VAPAGVTVSSVGPTNTGSLETATVTKTFLCTVLFLIAPYAVRASDDANDKSLTKARSRTFLFSYGATVTDLKPGTKARIWLPLPPSNSEQKVTIESKELPGEAKIGKDLEYGNQILYTEAEAGKDGTIPLKIVYRVTRREVRGSKGGMTEDEKLIARYLGPDALVPVGGKSLELIKDRKVPENQVAAARVFYDAVNGHMRYSKEGTGWGRGDSEWACDSRYGNCTDFHSLFISLSRSRKIPAKFEIGFPLPAKHGSGDIPGYHCWAWFKPEGKGWTPVDISEANKAKDEKLTEYYFGNLSEDRVAFSIGRDIELTPKQSGKPLNFFIYPYVEVDDKPNEKVQRKFGFEDVK
jgi:transglutaminase-like putative cysteine protease